MPAITDPASVRVVADVGGTNTRIALFDEARAEFRALTHYLNRDFDRLEDIFRRWLGGLDEPPPEKCCIAVAAPPSADLVVMSNRDWSFSCREFAAELGFAQLRRLNDFEANAYALPHLLDDERLLLCDGRPDTGTGRLATVGPGTGLGGACLDLHNGNARSFACEPGHMSLGPGNPLELEIFRRLLTLHNNIYAELLVSGPGLARLYHTIAEVRGEATTSLEPADISRLAVAGKDSLCVLALQTFCALLGSVCGDFLLANGAYRGLYIAGGIVPRMTDFLAASDFRRRMVEKGAMKQTLSGIPVYVITTGQPGLIGAAHVPL